MVLDGIPDKLGLNGVVAMGNDVSETDDPAMLTYRCQDRIVKVFESIEGLADNLELALDGSLNHSVGNVLSICQAAYELLNVPRRLEYVEQQLLNFRRHTDSFDCVRYWL